MTNGAGGAGIEAQSISWQFETETDGPLPVSVAYAATRGEADKILYTGLGEDDVAVIASRLDGREVTGLVVTSLGLPDLRGRPRPEAVEQSIIKGTEAVVQEVTGGDGPLRRAYGNSAGAAQLIVAAYHRPDLIDEAIAIAPGPLNPEALGGKPKEQAREVLDRFGRAGLDTVLEAAGPAAKLQVMRELTGGLLYAATLDQAAILSALRERLQIFVGERDQVTPPCEYAAGTDIDDRITLIPGMGHPTLLDDLGCRDVAGIIKHVEASTTPPEPSPV